MYALYVATIIVANGWAFVSALCMHMNKRCYELPFLVSPIKGWGPTPPRYKGGWGLEEW